ncbi:asparagine synthetase B [Bacteroidia bacterium]|nr:asparagine synthetase B [Bacteroidia bacterium]MDB4107852.1 asparagine synthetase B [Bacteroidia bacterium]MDB9883310.1 asparagine synthetase B [Bacteroidia bacterium]
MKRIIIGILCVWSVSFAMADKLIIQMDAGQKNHLKAYGIAYWVLGMDQEVEWLLNYKGGSFMMDHYENIEKECLLRGVSFTSVSESKANRIKNEIASPAVNADLVKLLKVPKIAVYSPKTAQPWDDAVTMVLKYAEIPYDVVFDDEVLDGKLPTYDWLHLHHEDFTGQYGKFYASFRNTGWYKEQVAEAEDMAAKHGFAKVSELKLAVTKKIRDFTVGGGFLFAMCSATDSYDIAMAADGLDICERMFDGDGIDQGAQAKLDYSKSFAFKNFKIEMNPMKYEVSSIDVDPRKRGVREANDLFALNEFSAKWDVIPTILTQNHERIVKAFMGQTTAFNKDYVKSSVIIMGENKSLNEARYIHGTMGKGQFTFYGGHDPEDYQHMVGEPPTDLNLHANSPGYRLILNNILFPSVKKKKQKT